MLIETVFEEVPPALIEPKARLEGVAETVTVAATPVPLRLTVVGELGALLVMETLPGSEPAVVGAKVTVNVALWPAAMVAGVESPLTL